MYPLIAGRTAHHLGLLNIVKLSKPAVNQTRWSSSKDELKIGDVVNGYKLLQTDFIKELNIKPYLLRHESTGAEHLHIQKDGDSNNVFAVALRTTPKDSTGVAHILEHLALCGSAKYPVRDPFFKMITRSLATFMNAMTAPDYTVYPFSTQNRKDYENLLNVYADAVFFPRLRPVDFRQEGWRLEHEKADKKDTPITIKGVVYNEMKGVFSSSSSIYSRQLLNNLFPDTTYRYESGGDPENIPDLTHDDLKKFHKTHYHPSNAKFFTYGDIPIEEHLKMIDEVVLSKFTENLGAKEESLVHPQEAWKEPRTVEITCPNDPMCPTPDKQTTTSVSYMLPILDTDYEDVFSVQLLTTLLTDGPNAPLYKSLIESGIGSDYSPSTGLANFTRQPFFSIGLQNIRREDIAKVHEIIDATLKDSAEKGFPKERIDAILHDLELSLKHVRGNFGLRLAMSVGSAWNHDGDAIDYLRINKYVEKFKDSLAKDDQYWKRLIEKHFLTNKHRLILNMSPDEKFEEKRTQREKSLIDKRVSALDEVAKQTVLYEGMELKKIQSAKENSSILPTLNPSKDISRDLPLRTHLKFDKHRKVDIQVCEQPTNEVVYFRAMTRISDKLGAANLTDYLPLFCDVATKLGAGPCNRQEFSQRIQLSTGGLGVSLMINPSLTELDKFTCELLIGSHCLKRNLSKMFDLWKMVFEKIHLQENKEYLFQLIKASAADLADGVAHSGHSYAMKKSSEGLTSISKLDERLSGLSYIARMKDIASKESIDSVAAKLQAIASLTLQSSSMRCAINAESEVVPTAIEELRKFIDATPAKAPKTIDGISENDYKRTDVDELKFPFATHYVAKSLLCVPRMHEDFAKLVIMSSLISTKYLLREVREKGGAYGAGLRVSNSGLLNFFSYRDPNTRETLDIFDRAVDWIPEASDKDIEESKLKTFQDVDQPIEPGKRGLNYFLMGETDDMRDEYRRRLLDVTKNDVKKMAEKYLKRGKAGTYIL